MDSATKQTAIVAEATVGTTPATPGFKLTRDIRVSGAPQRSAMRSPERRSDRMAKSMVTGLNTFPKVIELPWVRDAATDILWESLLCGAFSGDVLLNASTQKTFTLEEKYEGGATDPYRRLTGAQVDSCTINFTLGQPGSLSFSMRALAEGTATATIAGATYAAATPGYDPVSPSDIVVNTSGSLSAPKLVGLNMTISNNLRDQYAFGSPNPFGVGMGLFDISGTMQCYFTALADYSTFVTRQIAQALSFTIGGQANFKDTLALPNCDIWDPDVNDPGASGDHIVSLKFLARYYASSGSAAILTRNVA
jgi:hypothetical protein